ncbi:hypothetical protein ACP70R_008180 [Stipagrostis hirtigluma subsp. patula]
MTADALDLAVAGCGGEVAPAAGKTTLPSDEDEVVWVMSRDGRLRSVNPDGSEAEAPAAWTGMTRLTKEEVDAILSLDAPPLIEPYDDETLRRLFPPELADATREALREAAEVSAEVRERRLEFQDWVRGELEEKGHVDVPDKFLADREEAQEWMQEEIDKMFDRLDIPDRYFAAGSDNDDDE